MRKPAARVKPRIAKPVTLPAPVSGWIRNESLATPNARGPDGSKVYGAFMLENWFPTTEGVRMRAGSAQHSLLGDGSLPVLSLFKYVNGNNRSMFGAIATGIYDVTVASDVGDLLADDLGDFLVDDDGDFLGVGIAGLTATVGSLTGGDWSVAQFATSGGTFLRAVNGVDTPLVYDGTTWGTTPTISAVGLTATDLSNVWAYKNRLFFVQKNSLNAWYLPTASIGGTAVLLPLGGVFNLGGSLLFGASWSMDAGDGLSEQCVFVSTEGEVAVFRGDDPSVAASWTKSGIYRIGKPRGPHAFIRAGGDLLIGTDLGFVPLSQAVKRDYAALGPVAVSYPIETAWNEAVEQRSGDYWHSEIWPSKQMVLMTLATSSGQTPQIFVANARTGAWGLYTGWEANCILQFEDRLFYGSSDGLVIECEVTGSDQNDTYVCTCVPLFDPLKNPASIKTALQARATIRSSRRMNVKLSLQHDFVVRLPSPPDDTSVASGSLWGTALWGTGTWGGSLEKSTYQDWQSTPGSGYALAIATQITSGNTSPPDAEIISTDMTYDTGDVGS